MQYAIEISSTSIFQVLRGSVETYLRCDGDSLWCVCVYRILSGIW